MERHWEEFSMILLKGLQFVMVPGLNSFPASHFSDFENSVLLGFLVITHKFLDPGVKIIKTDFCVCECRRFYCCMISSIINFVKCMFYS